MMQQWFEDAKLGIFIHWGIHAINRQGNASWPLAQGKISHDEYMKQMDKFTADMYDPDSWADLIEASGAKYAVLTTKHHDGVTLWPTAEEGPCIPRDTNSGDLVGPFLDAIRKKDIRTGLYFSHTDWSNMDHFSVIMGMPEEEIVEKRAKKYDFNTEWDESFLNPNVVMPPGSRERWNNFLAFEKRQLTELLSGYGPIDLMWFDVMLKRPGFSYECESIREHIHNISDKTVINSRLDDYGDYKTPEQFIPILPPKGPWEVCMTTSHKWSYTGDMSHYKTLDELVNYFCDIIGGGGNYLINFGPDEHGIVPDKEVELLTGLGRWIKKHAEAVYGTRRGLPHGFAHGVTTLSKDEETIYVYLPKYMNKGTSIKGIRNEIKSITVVSDGAPCEFRRSHGAAWINIPGTIWIDVPEGSTDEHMTVLKVSLDGKLDLFDGAGAKHVH